MYSANGILSEKGRSVARNGHKRRGRWKNFGLVNERRFIRLSGGELCWIMVTDV